MKVHELVDSYKQSLEESKSDYAYHIKCQEHDIAFLQHLDPMTEVTPDIWKGYKPYDTSTPSNA